MYTILILVIVGYVELKIYLYLFDIYYNEVFNDNNENMPMIAVFWCKF